MTDSATALDDEIAALDEELTNFRNEVRRHILDQHYNYGWCLSGTQQALTDLDLPAVKLAFSGHAVLRVRINAVADAADYDEARSRVIQSLGIASADTGIDYELEYVDPVLDERELREDVGTPVPEPHLSPR